MGKSRAARKADNGPTNPRGAVTREVMRRRADWIPDVLPCRPGRPEDEWRITNGDDPEQLGRDLEEDLVIYPDGIHDFGTERGHSPLSLIREFGTIDGEWEIRFGGCPDYGPRDGEPYAVVGEPDTGVRRPSEGQMLAWLCRRLGGPQLPSDVPLEAAWPALAAAVGLSWEMLEREWALSVFDVIEDDPGKVVEIQNPEDWGALDLRRNRERLPAMRALDPAGFEKLEFSWDLSGAARAGDVEAMLDVERDRVRGQGFKAAADTGTAEEQWPEPVDIFGDGDPAKLADVPHGILPAVIESWAVDAAERMGAPVVFLTAAGLAVASAAIGSKLRIQPKEYDTEWSEPSFLWFAIVEEPGGKKSPVFREATKPLDQLDREHGQIDAAAHAVWKANKPKKGDPTTPEPKIRRRVVDNFTMEALTKTLADNEQGVLIKADELTGLFGSLDAYKANKGGDRPQLLRLFDGSSYTADRVGTGMTFVSCFGASVIGGIQPKKMDEISNKLEADGMLQRFLPIMGDGERRLGVDRIPDRVALERYTRAIKELAAAWYLMPEHVRLSPKAQTIWRELIERLARLQHVPNISDAWRSHIGKWGAISARLFLVFHALDQWVEHGPAGAERVVAEDTAIRAARMAEVLLAHALRFYEAHVGRGISGEDARWIAGHILSRGLAQIGRRAIGQGRHSLRGQSREITSAMQHLEMLGWCRPDNSSRCDRDGPTAWFINPGIHRLFADRAVAERARRERVMDNIKLGITEKDALFSQFRDAG